MTMVEPRKLCLVTGASAGIGAAFARVYAANGYDVALTARRTDRLEQLADEIRARFGVQALVFTADLAEPGAAQALVARIAAEGRVVDALVNNAGYGLPGTYANTRWSEQQAFVQVLLVAVCELTHRLLPGMVERGFGRVVNVASLAGLVPGMPGHTLYGPTKGFLVKFSQGLHLETLDSGVHVTALCPGFTYSEFHDVNGTRPQMGGIPSFMWLDAGTVAKAGYAAAEANRPVCVTGTANTVIAALARILPDGLVLALAARAARRMRRI
jgi:short-subunit dehydrogenase